MFSRQVRLYRWLLRLYPKAFRERHGDGMAQLVQDRLRDENAAPVWGDVLRELAITVPSQHWKAHPAQVLAAIALPALLVAAVPPKLNYLPLESLPRQVGGWSTPSINLFETDSLNEPPGTDYLQRTYKRNGFAAQLGVFRWSHFQIWRRSHSDRLPAGWTLEEDKPYVISLRGGGSLSTNRFLVTYNGGEYVGYWWRVAGERHGAQDWRVWVEQHVLSKLGVGITVPGTAGVRVILPVGSATEDVALERAAEFVQAIAPELRKTL